VGASPQVHDFEPGIADNGLFWTIPIAPGWVEIDPAAGSARFVGRNVPVPDFHDFDNAVGGGPSTPSRVDFEVRWTKAGDPVQQSSPDTDGFDFAGAYTPTTARITFTAKNDDSDVVYTSDPDLSSQINPLTPVVGTERNGVFHS
jgi:hypothetical protein